MKRLTQKLRSRRGETLTEMLVSIVILGLSIAMMVTMIITSTHLAEQSTEKDKDYRDQLSAAEKQEGEGKSGTVKITTTDDSTGVSIEVKVFGEDADGSLKSYKVTK